MFKQLQALRVSFDSLVEKVYVSKNEEATRQIIEIEKEILKISEEVEFELRDKFEERVLEKMEDYMKVRGIEICDDVVETLVGMDSDEAWKLRDRFINDINLKRRAKYGAIVLGLAGLDSSRAWEARRKIIGEDNMLSDFRVLYSLSGVDSDEAWRIREAFQISTPNDSKVVCESLTGLDSDRAWEMRTKLLKNKEVDLWHVLHSIKGLDSERAWAMRDASIRRFVNTDEIRLATIESLAGLDSERAWKMRERFIKPEYSDILIKSIIGLDSDRAWKVRDMIVNSASRSEDYSLILKSLAGLDSDRAWDLRKRSEGMTLGKSILRGLNGDYKTSPRIICKNQK